MHIYGPYKTYLYVFSMKQITYADLKLDDFYNVFQFENINFAIVNKVHNHSDPVILSSCLGFKL